jgi:chemotaxis protein methyltransferase WspC
MNTALSSVEALLKETMGLDSASIGPSSIRNAVQERQAACGLPDEDAYWNRLRESPAELDALIEAVIVPETWFFRERDAFTAMVDWVRQEWLPQGMQTPLRALSLPCATGEEPYSMAMALLDAGLPASRFVIDGVDISRQVLQRADSALYGRNAFRGGELDFRDRHFELTTGGYRLSDRIRRQVDFFQGNIFAPDFAPGKHVYDLIFCRNVLIYFDAATQQRAVSVLARLLKPSGCLFVGSSEAGVLLAGQFVSAKLASAPAFRRSSEAAAVKAVKTREAPALRAPAGPAPRTPAAGVKQTLVSPPTSAAPPAARARPSALPADLMEQAGLLADQGRLDEAEALCQQQLQSDAASPQALYLLGLIQDARGARTLAVAYYRKVLYLEPQHSAALIHLATLLDQDGDAAGARLLRARLGRIESKRHTS